MAGVASALVLVLVAFLYVKRRSRHSRVELLAGATLGGKASGSWGAQLLQAVHGNGGRVGAQHSDDIGLSVLHETHDRPSSPPPPPRINTLVSSFPSQEDALAAEACSASEASEAEVTGDKAPGEARDSAAYTMGSDMPALSWGQQLWSVMSGSGGRVAAQQGDALRDACADDMALVDLALSSAEVADAADAAFVPPRRETRYNTLLAPAQPQVRRAADGPSLPAREEPAFLSRHDHRATTDA